MANYYVQHVLDLIPEAALAPVERFILDQVFGHEMATKPPSDKPHIYYFAEESPNSQIVIEPGMMTEPYSELSGTAGFVKMIEDSRERCPDLCTAIEKHWDGSADLDLDEVYPWDELLKDVVKREQLGYLTVEAAFTASKMLPDGFGGLGMIIWGDKIESIATREWIYERLKDREDQRWRGVLDQRERDTVLAALRFWSQHWGKQTLPADIVDIATNGGTIRPLADDEIDLLCQRINLE